MKSVCSSMLTRWVMLAVYAGALALYGLLGPIGWLVQRISKKSAARRPGEYHILIIGTFYTRNWCISHLTPLSRASNVASITAVVSGPTHPIEKVIYSEPPRWLVGLFGRAFAKFFWALKLAIAQRPDLVMGYHLLPGALTALLVARCTGARSGYQMTAGPVEIIGGGAGTENFFLKNLGQHSAAVEHLAFAVARRFDLIVVRGRSAAEFMTSRELGRTVCVVPGSINTQRFAGGGEIRNLDVVTVCRLVEIKQPEHVLHVVARLKKRIPTIKAAFAGDGPLLETLRASAENLGITENVEFLGHVEEVEQVLKRAKIFLLTSRSEGLSIAMAEAMAAGTVPVVANVGELGELVRNGKTGWLVTPGNFEEYAERIGELLTQPGAWQDMSHAARAAAIENNDVQNVAARWAKTFSDVCGWPRWVTRPWNIPSRSQETLRLPSPWKTWEQIPQRWKHAASGLLSRVPPRWCLGERFQAAKQLIERADEWPATTVEAYQLSQLRRLCTWARERSPYYQGVFRDLGFDPQKLRTLDDFRRLPRIDKGTLREHVEAMRTCSANEAGIDRVSTGGTGGEPLSFYIGAERSAIEYAHLVNAWGRAGYDLNFAQAVLRGKVVAEEAGGLRHEYDPLLRRHSYSGFHLTEDQLNKILEHLATIGPCFLQVYPSSMDILARFVERSGAAVPQNIRGILAGSEMVYAADRRRAEEAFGVRYFSWYGHSEKLVFAAECEHSTDYHVSPTYGYLELLDDEGRPVTTPGQQGEIVGTGFINTVVPFIRYRTGDYATYVGDECAACGRRHMLLRDICGHRTQETLVGRDGSMLLWTALNMHDDTFDRVLRFQFVQSSPGVATLKIVPAGAFQDADRERILRNLARKVSGNLSIEIEVCDDIPLTRMGKTTYVDQRIDLSQYLAPGAAIA